MKLNLKLLALAVLAACLFFVACDDDEESGSAVCTDFAQELADIECLGIFDQSETKEICDASVKADCGAEYEDYLECSLAAGMTCGEFGGWTAEGCDEEYNAYSTCSAGTM